MMLPLAAAKAVVAFAGVRDEGRFIQQIAPGVIAANLVGSAGNADDFPSVGEGEFVLAHPFRAVSLPWRTTIRVMVITCALLLGISLLAQQRVPQPRHNTRDDVSKVICPGISHPSLFHGQAFARTECGISPVSEKRRTPNQEYRRPCSS
jgi:hypothetical protein